MKIGIFDSGVGGLLIAKAIRELMPEYDYVYLGDTKRVPYGNRSHETVYQFTNEAVQYLAKKERCALIVLACNTASARALARIQREVAKMPESKRPKVLGVLIPAAEEAVGFARVGVLATVGTVTSRTFVTEIKKVNPKARVLQNAAPLLVPLAEGGESELAKPFLKKYLEPLIKERIDALVLGCTHYPIFKDAIKSILPVKIKLIAQDEFIPQKLKDYLERHHEIKKKLSKNGKADILFTDKTETTDKLTREWFGENTKTKLINL